MIGSQDRVDVVLDVYVEDTAYRVRMVGVFQPGQPLPTLPAGATRNVVQAFLDVRHDVRAFALGRLEGGHPSVPLLHEADDDTPAQDSYRYGANGVGVRADLVQAATDAWARVSPTGDPALTLRSVNDGAINQLDNLARLAAEAIATTVEASR